nr:hypothetical protein [Tanacetum cinerariifolium]
METEDPAIITKSLLNYYDNFIVKLSSDEPNSDALNAQHQSPKLAPSLANIVQSKSNKRVVKISELRNSKKVDGAAIAIPIEAFKENTNLKKEDIKHAPIWVKLHHVPIVAYSEVRNTYARAMIEVAEEELNGLPQGVLLARFSIMLMRNVLKLSRTRLVLLILIERRLNSLKTKNDADPVVNVSDSEVDEEIVLDDRNGKNVTETNLKGASTPVTESRASSNNLARLCAFVFHHWSWMYNGTCCDKVERKELFFSFIYAHNKCTHRRLLWKSLCVHKLYVRDRPWCILGDFNTTLFLEDSTSGMSSVDISMREFKECVTDIEVTNMQRMGLQFTCNQKPKGKAGLLKKIDRIMANLGFTDEFVGSHEPKPFMFYNLVTRNEKFRDTVMNCWPRLDDDPFNVDIRDEEASTMDAFNEALLLQERFLKLKAKVSWLGEGDANTAYFHKAVKSRVSLSRIDVIMSSHGTMFHNEQVANVFVSHHEQFLGQPRDTSSFSIDLLFNKRLNDDDSYMIPWDIVEDDIVEAVCEFFANGKIVKELNHTIIALIPKEVLIGFGFHDRMVKWIMECVTTTSFSISINESLHGYFKGKRGLRQGDLLSPYLFTLVMEILTLLVNLCFADDFFLFSHGDVHSVKVIKEALEEFKNASGLISSLPKSTAYFCNVLNHVKLSILHILPFGEGRLPVKYLGVRLVSSRLMFRDCKEIIEKLESRIRD